MEIIFNGKSRDIQAGSSIQEFLDLLQINCQQVVVEHNRSIIPRQKLAETFFSKDDTLEVIHFVGGG